MKKIRTIKDLSEAISHLDDNDQLCIETIDLNSKLKYIQ